MFKKSYLIALLAGLLVLFMFNGIIMAQSPAEAKQKYEELVEQLREVNAKMKKANAEEYDVLLKEREAKIAEITKYRKILEGDQESRKKMVDVRKKYNEGTNNLKLRRYPDAVNSFQECITLGEALNSPLVNDVVAQAYYNKGQAHKQQRDYVNMEAAMRSAANLKSDMHQAYSELGQALERQRKLDEAEEAYQKALEINPKYDKAFFNLGVLYFKKKHFDRAIDSFMSVVGINSQNSRAFRYLGRSYFEKGEHNSAITAFENATGIDKRDHEAHWYWAQSLNKTGRYTQASTVSTTLIGLRKNFGGGYLERGKAYKGLGQKAKALADFESAKRDKDFRQLAEYQIKWYDKGDGR